MKRGAGKKRHGYFNVGCALRTVCFDEPLFDAHGAPYVKCDFHREIFMTKKIAVLPGYKLTVDLVAQTVTSQSGSIFKFEVEAFRRHCLLNGLDDIGLTLQHVAEIKVYEERRRIEAPWLF